MKRNVLTSVSLLPVCWQSWRTRWRWAAALWTARILTPPSKTCPACPSAPRRAATWRWSPPCPESERTLRSARHRSTRPPYAEVSNCLCNDTFKEAIMRGRRLRHIREWDVFLNISITRKQSGHLEESRYIFLWSNVGRNKNVSSVMNFSNDMLRLKIATWMVAPFIIIIIFGYFIICSSSLNIFLDESFGVQELKMSSTIP